MAGPVTENHAQQLGWQRHEETPQEQPFTHLYIRNGATQEIPTNLSENTRNLHASEVCQCDLIAQCRNEGHHLSRGNYAYFYQISGLQMSPPVVGKQGRCDGYHVSPVPSTCNNSGWQPRCVRTCECAIYRLSRYEPVRESTLRGVVS
jgi:hypothetical protein